MAEVSNELILEVSKAVQQEMSGIHSTLVRHERRQSICLLKIMDARVRPARDVRVVKRTL